MKKLLSLALIFIVSQSYAEHPGVVSSKTTITHGLKGGVFNSK